MYFRDQPTLLVSGLRPINPYAPVGCTTYAHIDPAKAALRAGSYQWESEKVRLLK